MSVENNILFAKKKKKKISLNKEKPFFMMVSNIFLAETGHIRYVFSQNGRYLATDRRIEGSISRRMTPVLTNVVVVVFVAV